MTTLVTSDVHVYLGRLSDNYVLIPVTVLSKMQRMVIDNTIVEFRHAGSKRVGSKVLMRRTSRSKVRRADWQYVEDKDQRRVFRRHDNGVAIVEWL
jgi:hypothetical protein